MKYKKHIEESFTHAQNNQSKLPLEILEMQGHSGVKTRHLYNNLCSLHGINYLEIGLFSGSTFFSSMFGNKLNCTGIDNWSLNPDVKTQFEQNLNKYKGTNNVKYVEKDCFEVDVSSLGKFDIYLYDGDHSSESHEKGLTHYIECMNESFIYIVDDWNWISVRNGTEAAINKLGLVVSTKKEIRTTLDNTHAFPKCQQSDWHNGICVYELTK